MEELDLGDTDTSRDDISFHELAVDGEGLEDKGQRASSETVSQLGEDETDGRTSKKKKKKEAQRIIQNGKKEELIMESRDYNDYNVVLVIYMPPEERGKRERGGGGVNYS